MAMILNGNNGVQIYFDVDGENGHCIESDSISFSYEKRNNFKLQHSRVWPKDYTNKIEKLSKYIDYLEKLKAELEQEAFEKL